MTDNIKQFHSNLYFIKDLQRTANYYEDLGFDVLRLGDAIRIKMGDFTLAFMDESQVQIDKESGMEPKGLGVFTYVEVKDVDQQYEFIKSNGVLPSSEPTSFPWGKREFAVKDPDGYKIIFFSKVNM